MRKKGYIGKIITSAIVIALSIGLVYINKKGINPVNEIKEKAESIISDKETGTKTEDVIDIFKNKKCMCKYWAEKYKDWESMGYTKEPEIKYEPDNKSYKPKVYGETVASDRYFYEYNTQGRVYHDYLLENKPKWVEDNMIDGSTAIIKKEDMISVGDTFCIPYYMTDITVNTLKLREDVKGIDNEGIIFKDFEKIADIQTGEIFEPDVVYIEMNITVECNCPWVTMFYWHCAMNSWTDKGEYYLCNNSEWRYGGNNNKIANDDNPAYNSALFYKDGVYTYFYPIKSGEKVDMKLGYFVNKNYLDELIITYYGGANGGAYDSDYVNAIKISDFLDK